MKWIATMLFALAALTISFLQIPAAASELAAQMPSPGLASESFSKVDCSRELQLKSPQSSQQVTITVTNKGSTPVKVYWITYEGGRKLYKYPLVAGDSFVQPTYAGHLWVVADEAERCLQIITAENKAEITLTPSPTPPASAKPDSATDSLDNSAVSGGESPFVDIVQFRNEPVRRPIASEHRSERTGTPQNKANYVLNQFVSIIDQALNNNANKLVLERSPNGKWIPVTVEFTAQDNSLATSGYIYLGRIIASQRSRFVVSLSEDGIVTGTQTGSTQDLRGAGVGNLTGTMTWKGTETLDLNTGLDQWAFDGEMDAHYPSRVFGGVKGMLTASDSVHRDLTVVPGIDESRTRGNVNVASDPRNPRALILGTLRLRNSTGESILRFSDHAVLSLPLVNRTGLDLNELHYTVTSTVKNSGIIDQSNLSGAFQLARDAHMELPLAIRTSFNVPAGGLNLVVTVLYRNTVLGRKGLMVPTDPFYRDIPGYRPDTTAPRLRAVATYFGTGGAASADPAPELTAAAAHDPLATMWEAVFYSQGVAGYTFDPERAYRSARHVLHQVEERARSGDDEALYLLYYACRLGVEGEDAEAGAGQFLDRSAAAGFLPARFDRARELTFRKDYGNAVTALNEVYAAGVKKAAVILGEMYEHGFGVERDAKSALRWYRQGAEFGDPEALLGLAHLTATGMGDTPPDASKAFQLARQAAARRYSGAYLFLGQAYASGRQGVRQDPASAIKAFSSAADLGDRQGMLALGQCYLGNTPGFTLDERTGVFWIRKAAERGSPKAMVILSKYYSEGTVIEKDVLAARYWYNQAALHGFVPGDDRGLEAQQQSFFDFWRYADFSPSYVYVNEYGTTVGDSGDGMFNGLFSGLFGAMTGYYGRQQATIDGLELIQKRNGKKIYGGTVSSAFTSKLQLKPGETVSIRTYGVISTGMFSGTANADGLGAAWPEYRVVPNLPTSAVIGKIGDSTWLFVGRRAQITASNAGPLALALNAKDYMNYKGHFDVVVEVPDEE